MTNNLAVVRLWASRSDIGTVSLQQDDLSIHLEITEGLDGGMTRRGEDDFVPFRAGRRRTLRWGDARPVVLNGWVMDTAASPLVAYRSAMDLLLAIFRETDEALVISAQLEDGTTRWIETWHPNVLAASEDTPPGIKRVSVEVSGEPYWHGTLGSLALDGTWILDGTYSLPSSAPITLTPNANPYDVPIDVLTRTDVEIVTVWFAGPSLGPPGASVVETGVGFTLGSALVAGRTATIDNDARTAVDDTGASLRSTMTLNAVNRAGEFLRLPGGRSTLRIAGAPTTATILLTLSYE